MAKIAVPAAWSNVEQFKAALQVSFEKFGKLTIERFINVEADVIGEPFEANTDV